MYCRLLLSVLLITLTGWRVAAEGTVPPVPPEVPDTASPHDPDAGLLLHWWSAPWAPGAPVSAGGQWGRGWPEGWWMPGEGDVLFDPGTGVWRMPDPEEYKYRFPLPPQFGATVDPSGYERFGGETYRRWGADLHGPDRGGCLFLSIVRPENKGGKPRVILRRMPQLPMPPR